MVAIGSAGCAAKYATVPPRLELQPYGRVAIVTFDGKGADTSFASLATRRFAEQVLSVQPGVEFLELGKNDPLVRTFRQNGDASALAQALGREKDVAAVFVGQLTLSELKPSVKLSASSLRGRATVTAELAVRMLSSRSGGTLWRSSFTGTNTVGGVSLSRGLPSISVRDPEEAYGELVRLLVGGVTRDFRPSVVKVAMEQRGGSGVAGEAMSRE